MEHSKAVNSALWCIICRPIIVFILFLLVQSSAEKQTSVANSFPRMYFLETNIDQCHALQLKNYFDWTFAKDATVPQSVHKVIHLLFLKPQPLENTTIANLNYVSLLSSEEAEISNLTKELFPTKLNSRFNMAQTVDECCQNQDQLEKLSEGNMQSSSIEVSDIFVKSTSVDHLPTSVEVQKENFSDNLETNARNQITDLEHSESPSLLSLQQGRSSNSSKLTIDLPESSTRENLTSINETAEVKLGPDEYESLEDYNQKDLYIDYNAIATREPRNNHESIDLSLGVEQLVEISIETKHSIVSQHSIEEEAIPVFSEYAQRKMEAAEKPHLKLTAANSKNQNVGNYRPTKSELRRKNYAARTCGAKIILSNTEATNVDAVLNSSKDDYMLNTCNNRIWFVVELCEAIKAQKIQLGNFELFSSSPKNFTVAIANRFPTREWSELGSYIAENKHKLQSFDLNTNLFGKFVRVTFMSHYAQEHYCPISVFRIFGTSEFEALDTEDDDSDDDYDSFADIFPKEQDNAIFSSDIIKMVIKPLLSAVRLIVQLLLKVYNWTDVKTTATIQPQSHLSPLFRKFSSPACAQQLAERIDYMLSRKLRELLELLTLNRLREDLINTCICAKEFGIDVPRIGPQSNQELDARFSYYLCLLPSEYIGALCPLLAERNRHILRNLSTDVTASNVRDRDMPKLPFGAGSVDQTHKNSKEATNVSTNPETATETAFIETFQTFSEKVAQELNSMKRKKVTDFLMTSKDTSGLTPEQKSKAEMYTVPSVAVEQDVDPMREDPNFWEFVENLSESTEIPSYGGSYINDNAPQKATPAIPPETTFIRLSNRIKALELNMSISGQYLEELSRNYKHQVEELHQTLLQQEQTVRTLEQQNRIYVANEQQLLNEQVVMLHKINKLHRSILIIGVVGVSLVVATIIGYIAFRATQHRASKLKAAIERYRKVPSIENELLVTDFLDHQQLGNRNSNDSMYRSNSEETLSILKHYGIHIDKEKVGDTSDA